MSRTDSSRPSSPPVMDGSEPLSLTESHLSIEATTPIAGPSRKNSSITLPKIKTKRSAGPESGVINAQQYSQPSSSRFSEQHLPPTVQAKNRTSSIDSEATLPLSHTPEAPTADRALSTNADVREKESRGKQLPAKTDGTDHAEKAEVALKPGEDLEKGKVGAIAGVPVEKPPLTKEGKEIQVVDWEGPDDPAFPKNWSNGRRMGATVIVAAFTFLSPMSSTMIAPASGQVARDFGITSSVEISMITSIFVLAYAFGPLFLGPASELYGRVPVLQLANLVYLVFNLACGFATSKGQILAFRFLAGLGGSAPLGIGAGVLGDLWRPEERGRAAAIYSLGPLLGPSIGPIGGAWIAERSTYKWVFWSTSIACVVIQILGLIYLRETYAPILLKKKAKQIRKERGLEKDSELVQTVYEVKASGSRKPIDVFKHGMVMPFKLIWAEHILQILAVYMAFIYGIIYITTVSTTDIFTVIYGESVGIAGLNYISQGLGFLIWAQTQGRLLDVVYRKLKERYGGEGKPEYRLPMMLFACVFLPLGLFMYGYGAQNRLHWIVPNIGLALIAAGMIGTFQSINMYIIDEYRLHAASAIAAAAFFRSICGFGFPLFAPKMFAALGYGTGCLILAILCIVIGWPVVPVLFKYGERIRATSRYAAKRNAS